MPRRIEIPESMPDFLGNMLCVGDEIITTPQWRSDQFSFPLVKGIIEAFTPKKIRIKIMGTGDVTTKFSTHVVKI